MSFDMDEVVEMAMEDTSPEQNSVASHASGNLPVGGFSSGPKVAIRKTFPEAWIWNDIFDERLVQ